MKHFFFALFSQYEPAEKNRLLFVSLLNSWSNFHDYISWFKVWFVLSEIISSWSCVKFSGNEIWLIFFPLPYCAKYTKKEKKKHFRDKQCISYFMRILVFGGFPPPLLFFIVCDRWLSTEQINPPNPKLLFLCISIHKLLFVSNFDWALMWILLLVKDSLPLSFYDIFICSSSHFCVCMYVLSLLMYQKLWCKLLMYAIYLFYDFIWIWTFFFLYISVTSRLLLFVTVIFSFVHLDNIVTFFVWIIFILFCCFFVLKTNTFHDKYFKIEISKQIDKNK